MMPGDKGKQRETSETEGASSSTAQYWDTMRAQNVISPGGTDWKASQQYEGMLHYRQDGKERKTGIITRQQLEWVWAHPERHIKGWRRQDAPRDVQRKAHRAAHNAEYKAEPATKALIAKYNTKPETKARRAKPEAKERKAGYNAKPEVKAYKAAYQRVQRINGSKEEARAAGKDAVNKLKDQPQSAYDGSHLDLFTHFDDFTEEQLNEFERQLEQNVDAYGQELFNSGPSGNDLYTAEMNSYPGPPIEPLIREHDWSQFDGFTEEQFTELTNAQLETLLARPWGQHMDERGQELFNSE
jgi:hypothetical protein